MKYQYLKTSNGCYNIYENDTYVGCLSRNFIHNESDFRASIENNSSAMDLREIADTLEDLNNAKAHTERESEEQSQSSS